MGCGFEFYSKYECRFAMFHVVLCCLAKVRAVQVSDTWSNNPCQMPTDLQFENEFQTGTERRAEYKNLKADQHSKSSPVTGSVRPRGF